MDQLIRSVNNKNYSDEQTRQLNNNIITISEKLERLFYLNISSVRKLNDENNMFESTIKTFDKSIARVGDCIIKFDSIRSDVILSHSQTVDANKYIDSLIPIVFGHINDIALMAEIINNSIDNDINKINNTTLTMTDQLVEQMELINITIDSLLYNVNLIYQRVIGDYVVN